MSIRRTEIWASALTALVFFLTVPQPAAADPISLEQALRRAMAENLEVAQARADTRLAELDFDIAQQPFLPRVTFDNAYNDRSDYASGRNRFLRTVGRVLWQLPVGAELSVGATTTWTAEGSGGIPLASVGVDVSQPLLAGAWGHGNDLEAIALNRRAQAALFIDAVNVLLLDAERAYWALVVAQRNVSISERSVERAQAQFDDTKENIGRGLLAPGDIFVVEENLVFFQQQLLRAQESRDTNRALLADLLKLEPDAALVASEDPLAYSQNLPADPPLEEHPRVVAQSIRHEQAQIRLAHAQQNRLPALDIRAGASADGATSPLSEAWSEVAGATHPNFEIGLFFEAPLSFSAADALVERQELIVRKAALERERVTRQLRQRWSTARNQVQVRQRVLEYAKRRAELSEKKLETELDKYKNGVSRLPEVVRFQRDVDAAELAVVRAQIDVITTTAALIASMDLRHAELGVEVR